MFLCPIHRIERDGYQTVVSQHFTQHLTTIQQVLIISETLRNPISRALQPVAWLAPPPTCFPQFGLNYCEETLRVTCRSHQTSVDIRKI